MRLFAFTSPVGVDLKWVFAVADNTKSTKLPSQENIDKLRLAMSVEGSPKWYPVYST